MAYSESADLNINSIVYFKNIYTSDVTHTHKPGEKERALLRREKLLEFDAQGAGSFKIAVLTSEDYLSGHKRLFSIFYNVNSEPFRRLPSYRSFQKTFLLNGTESSR